MKSIIASILALTLTYTSSTFANTASPQPASMTTAMEIQMKVTVLQIQKRKLIEEIAVNTVLAEKLDTETRTIREYASGDLTLSTILAQYPILADAAFAVVLGGASKFFNSKVIDPLLVAENSSAIARFTQKYPKLAKGTTWAASVVAVAAAIYYTVDQTITYADLKTRTASQIETLYVEKLNELVYRRDAVAIAVSALLKIDHALNQMKEANARGALLPKAKAEEKPAAATEEPGNIKPKP
jgi:hypothetical protein